MQKLIVTVILSMLMSATNPLRPAFTKARSASTAQNEEDFRVDELLADLGKQSGVKFTFEEAVLKGGAWGRIRSFRHAKASEGMDLKAVLDELSRSVPDFTWQSDPNNPKIIHIVDDRLLHLLGYALDRVIDDIDLSGTVMELVDTIAAKGIAVSSAGPASTEDLLLTDGVTRVQVRGKGLRVRDALSDFVPLEGRGSILWIALTRVDGSDQTSYIRFRGGPLGKQPPKQ